MSGLVVRSSDNSASHMSCLPLIPMDVTTPHSSALQAGSRVRHTREHAAMLGRSPSRKPIACSIVSMGKRGRMLRPNVERGLIAQVTSPYVVEA
ncbi:hypothetical protein C8Q73DRAFT_709429 [Cubamyces lactineus]|nr:hypothetical protein C8Q73DRAFT_709429 [Cubamyces lactineus]